MLGQIFVVVTYLNGHQHVTPLWPRELSGTEATARELATGEGVACGHAKDGDRIVFHAVRALDTSAAVRDAWDHHDVQGEFKL